VPRDKKRTLDIDFAKCAVDEYVVKGGLRHIRFFAGGEPTLEFQLMKDIYEYVVSKGYDILFEIQTNGSFDEEIAKWIADNIDVLWISMDLDPESSDMYRITSDGSPTSPIVERNLKFFKNMEKKRTMVGIRATITKYNVRKQKEGIRYLQDLGIRHIWVDPIFEPLKGAEGRLYEKIDTMEFAREFVPARAYAKQMGMFYESNYTTNFDGNTDVSCRACVPMPHLTADGYVSSCDMALYGEGANHMNVFIYAKYDKSNNRIENNNDRIRILRSRVLKNMEDECQICVARNRCAGYCLGESQNEIGNIFKVKECVCKPVRYLFDTIGDDYHEEFKYKHP